MTDSSALRKSPDAYRTISEVATDLKLPQHVLRFWETRFPQVKPLKRAGGRRFYRPEDVELLRAVKALLYGDGYTIKGVQRILREQGPRAVAALAVAPRPEADPRQAEPGPAEPAGLAPPSLPATVEPASLDEAARERDGDDETVRRLRRVLADLGDCARTLARARVAARQSLP